MICQNIKTFSHCLNYRHFACHMLTFANFNQGSFRNFLLILHCDKSRFMKQSIKWFVGTYRIINNISIVSAHSSSQNLLTSGIIFSFSLFFFFFYFCYYHSNRNYLKWNLAIIPDFGGADLDFCGNFDTCNNKQQQFCWKCILEVTLAFIGIVPSHWSSWSHWNSCSSKCNIGTRSRRRQFDNLLACCNCYKETETESCGATKNGCEQECNEENGSCGCRTGYVLNQGKWLKNLTIWKYRSSYLQVFYRVAALRNWSNPAITCSKLTKETLE